MLVKYSSKSKACVVAGCPCVKTVKGLCKRHEMAARRAKAKKANTAGRKS